MSQRPLCAACRYRVSPAPRVVHLPRLAAAYPAPHHPGPAQARALHTPTPLYSGHNRWSKIRHRKGIADASRSKTFARLTTEIHQSLRPPLSPDPQTNSRLAAALARAREAGLPKVAVEACFARARAGASGTGQTVLYEAIGPGGREALLIECMTDNPARCVGRVKEILTKQGCRISPVLFLFEKRGRITLRPAACRGATFDELFERALELGAEDVREVEDPDADVDVDVDVESDDQAQAGRGSYGAARDAAGLGGMIWEVDTLPTALSAIVDGLSIPRGTGDGDGADGPHFEIESSEITYVPLNPLVVFESSSDSANTEISNDNESADPPEDEGLSEARAAALDRVVARLEEHSEVMRVWTNVA